MAGALSIDALMTPTQACTRFRISQAKRGPNLRYACVSCGVISFRPPERCRLETIRAALAQPKETT